MRTSKSDNSLNNQLQQVHSWKKVEQWIVYYKYLNKNFKFKLNPKVIFYTFYEMLFMLKRFLTSTIIKIEKAF